MYHVSAQGVDERMINVHYYCYYDADTFIWEVYRPSIVRFISSAYFLFFYPHSKRKEKNNMCICMYVCVCLHACVWIPRGNWTAISWHNTSQMKQCLFIDFFSVCVKGCACSHTIITKARSYVDSVCACVRVRTRVCVCIRARKCVCVHGYVCCVSDVPVIYRTLAVSSDACGGRVRDGCL